MLQELVIHMILEGLQSQLGGDCHAFHLGRWQHDVLVEMNVPIIQWEVVDGVNRVC